MFRIGQKVVLVNDTWVQMTPAVIATHPYRVTLPRTGIVYSIRGLNKNWPEFGGGTGVLLNEIRHPGDAAYACGELAFHAHRFRPVVEKKTDISVFEEILRRETIDDRAPADPWNVERTMRVLRDADN